MKSGANVNAEDWEGETALSALARRAAEELLRPDETELTEEEKGAYASNFVDEITNLHNPRLVPSSAFSDSLCSIIPLCKLLLSAGASAGSGSEESEVLCALLHAAVAIRTKGAVWIWEEGKMKWEANPSYPSEKVAA